MAIYALQDRNGYVKIGIAQNPDGRILELQTGNPTRIELLGFTEAGEVGCEHALHVRMRHMGLGAHGEWFRPDIRTTIVAACISSGDLQMAMRVATSLHDTYCVTPHGPQARPMALKPMPLTGAQRVAAHRQRKRTS